MATGTDKQGPERNMTPIDTWAIAFGCMVGWGAFVMPGTTFLPLAGPAGTAIAMGLGILVILVIGWNFIYLMKRSSLTGGVYTYTKEAFGRDHALLAAWFLCLSYLTIVFLNGSALFVVLRTLFNDALQAGYHYTFAGSDIYLSEIAVSVCVVAVIGFFPVAAKPFIQRLHTVLSVVLLAGTALLTVFRLPDALKNGAVDAFGTMGVSRPYAIFSIVVLAPWAFVGFEITAFDTAHFGFPKKRIRGIVIWSILLAGFAYGSMSVVSVAAVPDGYASWGAYFADLDSLGGIASVPTFYAARSVMGRAGVHTKQVQDRFVRCDKKNLDRVLLNVLSNAYKFTPAGGSISASVWEISGGEKAVDMVAASEPEYYDAVLMDIQMPVMDGYTAARTIRSLENRELASVPILAMTANAFKEDEQAAAEAGMQAHIAKPIDVDSMLQKLAGVLSGAGKNTAHDNGQN